ncbi:MAG: hypothetical protein J6Y28_04050 [Acholeplasmatales bacterium]|nr:hypothetical protein [Methanobrevibacter sp.]MBP5445325.1 hypothetical protein [Acholeplasmatales bacterium]
MKVIRAGVFETNSSSTHSICICTEEEFDKWKNGELYYDDYSGKIISLEEIPLEERRLVVLDEDAEENEDLYDEIMDAKATYQTFGYEGCLEWYNKKFTTPSGDKMVAFGWYGYC